MGRFHWRRTAVLVLWALVGVGLAACGDNEDEPNASTQTPAPAQGSATVTIDMVDHAFQVSGPLIAGGTLKVANKGAEFHMIGVGRLKAGKTLADLQKVLSEGPPGGGGPPPDAGAQTTTTAGGDTSTTARGSSTTSSPSTTTAAGGQGGQEGQDPTAEVIDEVGLPGHFMGPGEAVELTVPNLQPGTYALVCFVPTEGEGAPHFAKGMVDQLEVVAGKAPTPPTADATYRLAPGKAVEGPATLTAGRHTLRFEAAPGSQQLEPGLARLNQGASFAQLDAALANLFEGQEPPAKGAVRTVPGQVVFGGFDLRDVTNFFLTVDLKPGNYVIVAEDTDEETPGPPQEMIAVTVR